MFSRGWSKPKLLARWKLRRITFVAYSGLFWYILKGQFTQTCKIHTFITVVLNLGSIEPQGFGESLSWVRRGSRHTQYSRVHTRNLGPFLLLVKKIHHCSSPCYAAFTPEASRSPCTGVNRMTIAKGKKCPTQSALRRSARHHWRWAVGESGCCYSRSAGSRSYPDAVKLTELCEPTGDVMCKYIISMLWAQTRWR